MVCGADGET